MERDSRKGVGEEGFGWGPDTIEAEIRERVRGMIETIVEEELETALGAGRSQRVGAARIGYRQSTASVRGTQGETLSERSGVCSTGQSDGLSPGLFVSNLMATAQTQTVLVTGGAGFIGSSLVDGLVERGLSVRVLDNFSTGRRAQINPRAELTVGDIRDSESIRAVFEGVDCVFHTAALPRVPLSIERPVETHLVNVVGTLNVLVAARDAKVRRVVYSGSSSVYGNQPILPLREDMAPNPLNPYALQKLTGEQYTRLFHQLFGLQTITLRYFNVYGPRMATEGAYVTVISVFMRAKAEGKPLTIHGDGEQTRDFTHVRDVVRANLLATDAPLADGRAINIGRGRNVSVNRIAELIGGSKVHLPPRPGDARDTLADWSQARDLLGWRPEVDIEDGLAELLARG